MIDQYGNKIQPQGKSEADPAKASAELRFMMNGFHKNQTAQTALNIAKKLTAYTKIGDVILPVEDKIFAVIEELTAYSLTAGSHDLCWELVYSLRNLSAYNNSINLPNYAAKYSLHSAKLFETICTLKPTAYNKCCKIIEFSNYVFLKLYTDTDSESNRILCLNVLEKEEENFKRITEKSLVYFKAGRSLYKNMYFIYKAGKDDENCFRAAREAAYYAREIYKLDKRDMYLHQYLTDYGKYAVLEGYSYADNEAEFNEALALAEELNKRLNSKKTNIVLNAFKKLQDLLTSEQ